MPEGMMPGIIVALVAAACLYGAAPKIVRAMLSRKLSPSDIIRKSIKSMYQYSATCVGNGVWMVRRWKDDPNDYTEAEMTDMAADAKDNDVIVAAIQRNSWA